MVIESSTDNRTLLGIDFVEDAKMVMNLPQRMWYFADTPSKKYDFYQSETIPSMSLAPSQSTPDDDKKNQVHNMSMTPPELLGIRSPIPMAISPIPNTPLRNITNHSNQSSEKLFSRQKDYSPSSIDKIFEDAIPKHSTLSRLELSLYDPDFVFIESISAENITLKEHEAPNLNATNRTELNALLLQNKELFQLSEKPAVTVEHSIPTGNHEPIAVPPYRLSEQKKIILQNEVTDMLNTGIIEECESPWASPVVMVPKKDGGIRVCIDYRKLNSVTKPDVYPLPRLDDLLHAAKNAEVMSTIDLLSGYWQIKMKDEDKDKTAFITPFGVYRFLRMPFGLRNAPSTFQRLIDRVKTKLSNVRLLAFIDDLLILSSSFEQHLIDLDAVFTILNLYNLRINRKKCCFCRTEVKFLGHILTKEGISPDPDKVSAIKDRCAPKNLKEMISFLQTCSWFRRFIPEFAKISRPLSDLTKKNAKWVWEVSQQNAFDELKNRLITAPILRQEDETKPFTIRTDASGYAVGAALLQGEGSDERPVEYASRLMTSAERNYNTTEREALAVVWAIRKFQSYIEGNKISVITDHQALRWLMTLKSPTGRLSRWCLELQPYDIQIQYTPGKANILADMLSRPPIDEEISTLESCVISVDFPHRSVKETRDNQLEDPDLKKIIDDLESFAPERFTCWTTRGYMLHDGVLYRYNQDDDSEEAQLVLPKNERQQIMSTYHDEPTAGHYGSERTLQRISARYFWPCMRRDIGRYVKDCTQCQRYKIANLKPAGLLQTPVQNQRFEVLAIDLFGPLPPSNENMKWIFIVEDVTTRWVELFALEEATATACGKTLITEVFLRFGLPRRLLSDNGTQFISAVMQHITHCLGITQCFIPVYHPQANPVERKNRDLKTQLAILVGNEHFNWPEKLPFIRFAMNTVRCQTTGYSAAFLNFGRELRAPDDVQRDFRSVIQSENFVPGITPYLNKMAETLKNAREVNEKEQDRQKSYADLKRRPNPIYSPGDYVWVDTKVHSKATNRFTSKFAPRRDGPYIILNNKGSNSYEIASPTNPHEVIGIYHTSALTKCTNPQDAEKPLVPIRRRGRPRRLVAN